MMRDIMIMMFCDVCKFHLTYILFHQPISGISSNKLGANDVPEGLLPVLGAVCKRCCDDDDDDIFAVICMTSRATYR